MRIIVLMDVDTIKLEYIPDLKDTLFIAGFEGWGNALDVSRGMLDYMIKKTEAKVFGEINPDYFYRYDEARPYVHIENGQLKRLTPPGGRVYLASKEITKRDIVFLKANEPHLNWLKFVRGLLGICEILNIEIIITIGSMYDNVLHSDRIVSCLASDNELLEMLRSKRVLTINYKGPSAIHSTIQSEAQKRGMRCISLWCHCPYYLQGTTHFGIIAHLGSLISSIGGFPLDIEELEIAWSELNKQIQAIVDKSPELQEMINQLRKEKIKGTLSPSKKGEKVIRIEDFLKPKS